MIADARLLALAKRDKPLMIFDSLIRFHSADENAASEMSHVMESLRGLANAGATVVVLHHKSKNEKSRYRGSSDILAAVDVAMSLARDGELLKMSCIKNRHGLEFSLTLLPDFPNSGTFLVSDSPNNTQEDVQRLTEAMGESPGITQNAIIAKSGLPRARAMALLGDHDSQLWRSERGPRNSKRYFLRGRDPQPDELVQVVQD